MQPQTKRNVTIIYKAPGVFIVHATSAALDGIEPIAGIISIERSSSPISPDSIPAVVRFDANYDAADVEAAILALNDPQTPEAVKEKEA